MKKREGSAGELFWERGIRIRPTIYKSLSLLEDRDERGLLLLACAEYLFSGIEYDYDEDDKVGILWETVKPILDAYIEGAELYITNQAARDYENKLWEISLESYEDIRKPERFRIRQLIQQGKKPGEDEATDLREMDYQQFLNTGYWKILSAHIKAKNNHSCQLCGAKTNLEVHHITYEHRGCESAYQDDLACLCHNCHAKEHEKESCYEE